MYVTSHLLLHIIYSTFSTPHTSHSTLDTWHSRLYTWRSALYTLHSALYTLPSTLHTLHPQPADSSSTRSPNHLQHLWNCCPAVAILRYCFLNITSHPLAHSLVPNPYGCCFPLSHFTLHNPPIIVTFQPPTVMILSPLVHRLPEAQTIYSIFGIVNLALQPFVTPSSISLLIPLQTLLFRTPTNAALRCASEFLHFPPFSPCF